METPHKDYIGYNDLIDDAKRTIVVSAINHVIKHGLNGDHHFYLTFDTRHTGVRIPSYLHARYPTEMAIVIQYKFWNLKVDSKGFSVLLSFDGKPEKLSIPFKSLLMFTDRGMNFTLRFTPTAPDPAKKTKTKPEVYLFQENKADTNQNESLKYEIGSLKEVFTGKDISFIDERHDLRENTNLKLTLKRVPKTEVKKKNTELKKQSNSESKKEMAKVIQLDTFRKQK